MLQNSRVSKIEFKIGDMLEFSNFPFKGWAYVTDMKKLENGFKTMVVTSLLTPNRSSICDPNTISWYVNIDRVKHVPIIRTI